MALTSLTAKTRLFSGFFLAAGPALFLALALALGPLTPVLAQPDTVPVKLMFGAAMIRYDKYSQALTSEQWQQILEQISDLQIKTIIIQYHHFVPRKTIDGPALPEFDFLPGSAPVIVGPVVKPLSKTEASETTVGEGQGAVSKYALPKSLPGKVTAKKSAPAPVVRVAPKQAQLDTTGLILDYADKHNMNVYLGLWMDINWFANLDVMDQLAHNLSVAKADIVKLQAELTDKTGATVLSAADIKDSQAAIAVCKRGLTAIQEELDEKSIYFQADKDGQLAGPTVKLADALFKIYGKHKSFSGWYLPEEIWDAAFSSETTAVLNPLLKFITEHCRKLSVDKVRPFAMSPHASVLHYDSVDEIVESHTRLLKDSGVDVLMLSDSIGDLNLKEEEDIAIRLKKHFTAFKKVCVNLNMQLWAELETYAQTNPFAGFEKPPERKPTNIARLKKQFQYTYPYLSSAEPMYVVFDYLNYFSLLDGKYPDAELRARLYDNYKRDFVESSCAPLAESSPEKK